MDVLKSPEPEQKIQSDMYWLETTTETMLPSGPTDANPDTKDLAAYSAEHQFSRIVDGVHLRMLQLESTDNVVRPGGDGCNRKQAYDAWD